MKTFSTCYPKLLLPVALLSAILWVSCNKFPTGQAQGTLAWHFDPNMSTRSLTEMPDTDSFILQVKNSGGEILYNGAYSDSPMSMPVNPGTYTLKVLSCEFEVPAFNSPQFGDEQVVVVQAGTDTKVVFNCTQVNSGLRLRTGDDFAAAYPQGRLYASSKEGDLDYGQSESRIGYFKPGEVSVWLNDGDKAEKLFTRSLEPREILTMGISCPGEGPSSGSTASLSIQIDTLRYWSSEDYEIGSGSPDAGSSISSAYGVGQAMEKAGEKGVWVCGYIVGGDLTSTKNGISFEPPFSSMTCLAIAARTSVSEKSSCMSVQLSKGDFRDALNLVEHPELLGRKVFLKGDIVSAYYGIPGIQNLTEYSLK
ncbi:MAG: DUF4493 domain-containing protein [Bacteroidales bacterium]|nr:DUF4493 domain-containing protein [Bacteroidales bacterium]